jgi:hypothetical protein
VALLLIIAISSLRAELYLIVKLPPMNSEGRYFDVCEIRLDKDSKTTVSVMTRRAFLLFPVDNLIMMVVKVEEV